jgi:hypothetical protein
MKSIFSKVIAGALFSGLLAISGQAAASDMNASPFPFVCESLQSGIQALVNLADGTGLDQALKLVAQMEKMGCPADLIPTIPTPPAP